MESVLIVYIFFFFKWLLQEIYPPKVHQFAYVTDGACTEEEILSMEIIIMKVNRSHTLKMKCCLWSLMHTHDAWVNVDDSL